VCTDPDACSGGACVGGPPLDCDDGFVCTIDTCDPLSGCVHTQADTDADTVCDAVDNCPQTPNPGQQNADGDLRGDACDCSPSNPAIWAVPSDVTGLPLAGTGPTSLTWSVPSDPGGNQQVLYDVLRSGSKGNFTLSEPSAICVATGAAAPSASDPAPAPAAGSAYYYLVRATNACGGTLGTSSAGTPRPGRPCPQALHAPGRGRPPPRSSPGPPRGFGPPGGAPRPSSGRAPAPARGGRRGAA